MFGHFHIHVSYIKTLTEIELCSERILTFCTLNEHILLIKCASDENTTFGGNSVLSARKRRIR